MAKANECPRCGREGKILEFSSNDLVSYYRCDPCHHVWADVHTIPQPGPRDVTKRHEARDDRLPKK